MKSPLRQQRALNSKKDELIVGYESDATNIPQRASDGKHQFTVGERFRSHNRFNNIHIPVTLAACKKLPHIETGEDVKITWSAKMLFAVIALHEGKQGNCFASLETMADELGASEDSVGTALDVLVSVGLVRRRRRRNQTAICELLWHPVLNGSLKTQDSAETRNPDIQDSANPRIRTPQKSPQDSAETRNPFKEEKIQEKNPLKESVVVVGQKWQSEPTTTTDSHFNEGQTNTDLTRARQLLRERTGTTPDNEILGQIVGAFGEFEDFEDWFTGFRCRPDVNFAYYKTAALKAAPAYREQRQAERQAEAEHDAKCKGVSALQSPEKFQGEELFVIKGFACQTCGHRRGITKDDIDAFVDRIVANDPEIFISERDAKTRPRYFCDDCGDFGYVDALKEEPCQSCDRGKSTAEAERIQREAFEARRTGEYEFDRQEKEWVEIAKVQSDSVRRRMVLGGDLGLDFAKQNNKRRAEILALIQEGHHREIVSPTRKRPQATAAA